MSAQGFPKRESSPEARSAADGPVSAIEHGPRRTRPDSPGRKRTLRASQAAFTLLETTIVLAIVAILAAIALPSYDGYVKRSRILDAVARLSDARARMDDYFLDQRSYLGAGGACGAAPSTGATDYFEIRCEATATTFLLTASGHAANGMNAFTYTLDHSGAKATVSVPSGWSRAGNCWTIRKDGLCV